MKHKFMRLASKLAKKSNHKFKIGCVIVKGNRVLSLGFNYVKCSCEDKIVSNVFHAEIDALKMLKPGQAEGSTVYLFRETKNKTTANSKPCVLCHNILKMQGVKKVYYTVASDKGWEMEKYV